MYEGKEKGVELEMEFSEMKFEFEHCNRTSI
jgi:hypothetical protein